MKDVVVVTRANELNRWLIQCMVRGANSGALPKLPKSTNPFFAQIVYTQILCTPRDSQY